MDRMSFFGVGGIQVADSVGLVGLMFSWFLPCLFSFSGGAGARIVRPVCFGLLWLSLYVRCHLVRVLSVWFCFVVSRVPVGLLLLLLSFPRLLCSSLLLVCGVASAWLASRCSAGPSLWVS